MDNKEIRRRNLLTLIKQYGSAVALADAIGTDVTYIRNIKNQVRDMGDDLARRIEEKVGKPRGWMDTLHAEEEVGARQLVEAYVKAAPAWKVILQLLANLPADRQPEIASAINDALAGESKNPDGNIAHDPLYNSREGNKSRNQDKQKKRS